MKKIIFCTVRWKYENEKYERFSMDKEKYADFKEYVAKNLGKIIQEEEIDKAELSQEPITKKYKNDLTPTEKLISRA